MPLTREEIRAARQAYLDAQTEIIASELNRFYTSEKVGPDPDIFYCGIHFADNGGAEAFYKKYGHYATYEKKILAL